ncbi:Hypothetical protein PHPALM_37521 [Phytophthora palmivora]|uniref:Uncharacterized protein n=1 Tax=Phytophthora palmivora TaxID=4796 RepID=A0A2P4WX80_9STRA|nr:Hypothetical protein PHPALM_37521 [Phytophthora palmivora]
MWTYGIGKTRELPLVLLLQVFRRLQRDDVLMLLYQTNSLRIGLVGSGGGLRQLIKLVPGILVPSAALD